MAEYPAELRKLASVSIFRHSVVIRMRRARVKTGERTLHLVLGSDKLGAIAPASAKRPPSTSSSLRFFLDMPASFHSTVTTSRHRKTKQVICHYATLLCHAAGQRAACSFVRSLGIFVDIHVPFRVPAKRVRSRRTTVP